MIVWVVVFALLAVVVAAAPVAAQKNGDESSSCISTQTSGTGEKLFATCVTDTGNVAKFITPASVENLNIDSYMICDSEFPVPGTARAYSHGSGFGESNFSFPTTKSSTSNVRTTADGRYRLSQSFARDATERQLTITMTLKNLGPGSVTNVRLQRAADIDAGNSTANVFLLGTDSISAVNPSNGHGMTMGVLTPEISHNTFVETFSDFTNLVAPDYDDCGPTQAANPLQTDDYVGIIRFNLGTMAAGASKTVKIFYQRF